MIFVRYTSLSGACYTLEWTVLDGMGSSLAVLAASAFIQALGIGAFVLNAFSVFVIPLILRTFYFCAGLARVHA